MPCVDPVVFVTSDGVLLARGRMPIQASMVFLEQGLNFK